MDGHAGGAVNIRGWLEGDTDQVVLVQRYIDDSVADHWYNFCWAFPHQQDSGHWYAFYGAFVDAEEIDWFVDQLRRIAELGARSGEGRIRGLFLATDARGESVRWQVADGLVTTAPADARYEFLGA